MCGIVPAFRTVLAAERTERITLYSDAMVSVPR